ncbi:MAG TPA: hypothetical protein PK604_01865 [Acetivibrio clariflavus]|nr:hypothetical protein [Acetivibrio clariflavus]HPU41423.1 hypothetical protein [Acetivibrio clariflavus]
MVRKYSGFKDVNNREIYTGMLCEDIINFNTVVIKEIEGRFFAVSNEFKPEPLEEVSEGLRIIK